MTVSRAELLAMLYQQLENETDPRERAHIEMLIMISEAAAEHSVAMEEMTSELRHLKKVSDDHFDDARARAWWSIPSVYGRSKAFARRCLRYLSR